MTEEIKNIGRLTTDIINNSTKSLAEHHLDLLIDIAANILEEDHKKQVISSLEVIRDEYRRKKEKETSTGK